MENRIDHDIDETEAMLMAALAAVSMRIAALVAQLETNNGLLAPSPENLDRALALRTEIAIAYAEYHAAIDRVAETYRHAAEIAAAALISGYSFSRQDARLLNAIIADTRVQLLHLGTINAAEVANAVYVSVVTGTSRNLLVTQVDQLLTGSSRSMAAKAKTVAATNYMAIHNLTNRRIGIRMGAKRWLYKGTLIPESRDFCAERAGKIFTTKQVDSWNALSWAGKAGNVWTNCGGWNCRHTIIPFIETGR